MHFILSKKVVYLLLFIIFLGSLTFIAYRSTTARSSDVCFACHEDMDLFMEKDGKKISLYINPKLYKQSVHGTSECTDCHLKYDPNEVPHTKTKSNVDCKSCHDDLKGYDEGIHKDTRCSDCHSKHEIKPAKEFAKEQTKSCIKCHNQKSIQNFTTSTHFKNELGCESCHISGHKTKKVTKQDVSSTCGKCHGVHQKNFQNSVHQTVLNAGTKNAPTCTDCHGAHQITSSKMSIESQGCLKCHLNENMFPGEGKGSAKFVSQYRTSVHASIEKNGNEAAGCIDCHGNHDIQDPQNLKTATLKPRNPETCGQCHKDIVDKFFQSAHGKALLNKLVAAPTCVDCHSEHSIKAVRKADEFSKINQVEMCLNCHINGKLPHKNYKGEEVLISNYKDSYHYAALQNGKLNAATCSDCHGSHEMKKFDEPDSRVNKKNIENTCGQANCHTKQLSEFTGSVHEVSISSKNNSDAPTCTNCHGNHQILKKDEQQNRLSNSKGLIQLCSNCHSSVEIVRRYNLPTGRSESYLKTFHGLAVSGGSKTAANCESCHGYHNIRPSTDSLSSISKKNLPKTCGRCHPGADATLFVTKIHLTDESKESPTVYWITLSYTILIVVVIGGMVVHNVVDFSKKVVKKNGIKKSDYHNNG